MNWRDYLAFNRSERKGIIVFIFLLTIIILLPKIHKNYFTPETHIDPSEFKKDILAFEEQLKKLEELEEADSEFSGIRTESTEVYESPEAEQIVELKPFEFDPNNLPEDTWLEMGMPKRVAGTIKNFESAGGTFRVKEDLKKIYGITDNMYETLRPYINLPGKDSFEKGKKTAKEVEARVKQKKEIEPEKPLIVDINTADTLKLMEVRGIGPFYSKEIVKHREALGGYVSVEQLMEIYGMDKERFESLRRHFTIKDTIIQKININEADFGDMIRHPYFDRSLVNNLLQIREQHGKFQAIEDIKKSHLVDEEVFTLITPYLSVE